MASTGESNIDNLIAEIREAYPGRFAIQQLALVCELQQELIKVLEREIFDRCSRLRDRVARLEQPNGK